MNEQTQTIEADEDNGDTTSMSNDQRYNDFVKRVRKYGSEAAAGADSLPKLALDLTRMSKDGVIDLETNKKAIHELYDIYWAKRAKAVHSQTKEGRIAQVSKLKAFHTLGGNTSFDGEEVLNRAVRLYKDMRDAEIKLKSVYAAYVDVARMANDYQPANGNTEPTDDDIKAAMLPKDKDAPTVADVIQKNRDILEALITGERKDGLTCQDQEVIDAVGKLDEWLAKLTLQAEMDALTARLCMGFTLTPANPQPAAPVLQIAYSA